MIELNPNVKERDEIIFGEYDEEAYSGGTRHFDNISFEVLQQLLEQVFIKIE